MSNSSFCDALNSLKPTTKDGKEFKSTLLAFASDFKDEFTNMFTEMKSDFLQVCRAKDAKIEQLEGEVSSLKTKLYKLEEKIDDQEAYERRDTIIISGEKVPIVTPNENCTEMVCKLMEENLNLSVNAADISVSHRLGPKPITQKADKRKIIIKLCRRENKINILRCARAIKPQNLFFSESLTIQRQEISAALRKARRQLPNIISGTTTIDGSVYVWTRRGGSSGSSTRDMRHKINSMAQFEDFCQANLQMPASRFLYSTSQ